MKSQKGFIVPALIVLGVLVLGGLAYYSLRNASSTATSTPASVIESDDNNSRDTETTATVTTTVDNTSETSVQNETGLNYSSSNKSSPLVEVTAAGTLAQRLGLTTLTDTDYSYAISYPKGWSSSGASSLVTVSNGRSSIIITSQNIQPETSQAFAMQNGVTNGITTTEINAYNATAVPAGNQTTYYIVNGAVGYKLVVTDLGDTEVLRTILLTFTVTKQR